MKACASRILPLWRKKACERGDQTHAHGQPGESARAGAGGARAGLTAVISSSIESSLGLTQLARITAWLTPDTIPGLDTLDLMQAQQVRRWPGSTLPFVDVDALERLL